MADPRSRPSRRPVTPTKGCRSSRLICCWPGWMLTVAIRSSGTARPSGVWSCSWRSAAMRPRRASGARTRTPTMVSPCCTSVATEPPIRADSWRETASGSSPSRAAAGRLTWTTTASPATRRPSTTSTTPGIFSMAGATKPAASCSAAVSEPKSFTSMGWGTAVRSPMRSSISWAVSMSRPGTSCSTRWRTSAMTFSMPRRPPPFR